MSNSHPLPEKEKEVIKMMNDVTIIGRFYAAVEDEKFLLVVTNQQGDSKKVNKFTFELNGHLKEVVEENIKNSTINESDIVGIKGYLDNDENGHVTLVAKKISFLARKKKEDE